MRRKNYRKTILTSFVLSVFLFQGIALLALFSICLNPMEAMAQDDGSTKEIQRAIQQNWAAVESLNSKYDATQNMSDREIARLGDQIEETKTIFITAPEGSAGQLNAQTRLIELLTDLHIEKFRRSEGCRGLAAQILGRILDIERNLARMQKMNGGRNTDEVGRWREKMFGLVSDVIEDARIESLSFANELHACADPTLREYISNSQRYCESTSRIVLDLLHPDDGRGSFSTVSTQKRNCFNFRGAFETLAAELKSKMSHNKQILLALKGNAELQAASIVKKLLEKTVGNIIDGIKSVYAPRGRSNAEREKDWDYVRLTEPRI